MAEHEKLNTDRTMPSGQQFPVAVPQLSLPKGGRRDPRDWQEVYGQSCDRDRSTNRSGLYQSWLLRLRTTTLLVVRLRQWKWSLRFRLVTRASCNHTQDCQGIT